MAFVSLAGPQAYVFFVTNDFTGIEQVIPLIPLRKKKIKKDVL